MPARLPVSPKPITRTTSFIGTGRGSFTIIPENAMRICSGHITPDYTGFQTAPDLLGVSVQQTYAQLQPTKYIRPTGSHSFRIERPSEVDIIIDNVLFRHIRLAPGNYDLSELPLRPGANNVKLEIVDDTGTRRTLEFTAFSGTSCSRRASANGLERGHQVLRSGRCGTTEFPRRYASAEFSDCEQEIQQRFISSGTMTSISRP